MTIRNALFRKECDICWSENIFPMCLRLVGRLSNFRLLDENKGALLKDRTMWRNSVLQTENYFINNFNTTHILAAWKRSLLQLFWILIREKHVQGYLDLFLKFVGWLFASIIQICFPVERNWQYQHVHLHVLFLFYGPS